SSSISPPFTLSSSTSPPSSLSCTGTHHVFASFRGEDVRRKILSYIQQEFQRKGIIPFIDNEIKRGESIGPELIKAIRESKIAIVLLSRNYASSKWCLDELLEIMECKKKFGLTVFVVFYEVDPSHVKKLTGEFGAVFQKTCKGRTMEEIWRWRQAFEEVATIAGYDSRKWENEAAMVKEIVTEISKRLGMSKEEWKAELPRLRVCLNGDIYSILKYSYDALDDIDKDLFLHIACFFNAESIDHTFEDTLIKKFPNVRQGFRVLVQRSLISEERYQPMHNLLVQLGREIVRKQSNEPGKRQFLVDPRDVCEVLTDHKGSESVIGLSLEVYDNVDKLNISERAFEKMSNLQFLRIFLGRWHLPQGLNNLPPNLRILDWDDYPMTCLPSKFNPKFLVKILLKGSKLEKLWEENQQPLINLKVMDLRYSENLKELPNLSKATNLVQLCSSLVELPLSIGNLTMLKYLSLQGCSKVKVLPNDITLDSLEELDVSGCSQLTSIPEISTNIESLMLCGTLIKEVPLSIKSWSRLHDVRITYCKELEEFPHALDIITELELNDTEIEEVPTWVSGMSRLRRLVLNKCTNLVSLPQLPDSLTNLDAESCESLETLACSFPNPEVCLKFIDCWKLNEKGRDIIIQPSTSSYAILPGREIPEFFTYRATTGGSVVMKFNQRRLPTSFRFKACILLVYKGDEADYAEWGSVYLTIIDKQSGRKNGFETDVRPFLTEHLYIFEMEVNNVESREIFFEFGTHSGKWEIGECGIRPLLEEDTHVESSI
ncbi:Winged helix DNA-binding domain superfamily, partial [Arabidopsis suecica]